MIRLTVIMFLCLASPKISFCQTKVTPSPGLVAEKWKRDDSYKMIWYMIADTLQKEMATISTEVKWDKNNNRFYGIQSIQMNRAPKAWIDSTVAGYDDLSPIYHSSYNMQRDMSINYSKRSVKGYFKMAGKEPTQFEDKQTLSFFDFNLLPFLINYLPLHSGYTATIPVYDYNGTEYKISNAYIKECESYSLKSNSGTMVECWKVSVEMDAANGGKSVYYISKSDRKTMMIEVEAGPRKMKMVRE